MSSSQRTWNPPLPTSPVPALTLSLMVSCSGVRLVTLRRTAVGIQSLAPCVSPGAWRPPPPWSPRRWWGRSEKSWTPTAATTSSASASCFSVSTATLARTIWSSGRWRCASCPAFRSTACASRGYRARPSPLRTSPAKLPTSSNCDSRWSPSQSFLWSQSHLITGLVSTRRTKFSTDGPRHAVSGWTRLVNVQYWPRMYCTG